MKAKLAFFSLTFLLLSCGTEEPQANEEKFLTGSAFTRGHEDITRFGVEFANARLQERIGQRPLPDIQSGVSAAFSDDPLVRGNYETDFPQGKMYRFNNASESADWHKDPSLQFLHSLRGQDESGYRSTKQTCRFQQNAIKKVSRKALDEFQAGNRTEGLYWLGHATHIIQDSFSEAHTTRSGNAAREIKDFCIYGNDVPGICHHGAADAHDYVWRDQLSCTTDPNNRSWDCLKDSARWAAEATGAYLTTMGRMAFAGESDFDGLLDSYLNDGSDSGSGYFNCSSIPEGRVGIDQISIVSSGSPLASCKGTWKSAGSDMNDGAGGKFLELCYKAGEPAAPVDSLSVVMGRGASCPAGQEKIEQDLNEGAGGEFIYLCVGRGNGKPVHDIKVTSDKKKGNRCGGSWNFIDADLNKGASGKYIYICYK